MKQHTNEEIMEYFDIKPGDRFEYLGEVYVVEDVLNFTYYVKCRDDKSLAFTTCEEVQEKIKPLPRVKRLGDFKCLELSCERCPLKYFKSCCMNHDKTLYQLYRVWSMKSGYKIPELEAKLDEEVEIDD